VRKCQPSVFGGEMEASAFFFFSAPFAVPASLANRSSLNNIHSRAVIETIAMRITPTTCPARPDRQSIGHFNYNARTTGFCPKYSRSMKRLLAGSSRKDRPSASSLDRRSNPTFFAKPRHGGHPRRRCPGIVWACREHAPAKARHPEDMELSSSPHFFSLSSACTGAADQPFRR